MPNQLAHESSPYLLQHAENPVDWHPWGPEALKKSKDEDKPIFLSIGYSACHWCHVMEHESFENDEIAAFLNEHFVSIKVDREERPDLDQIYMQAVMSLQQGQGGWPLSAFLTPECHLFFGGTYWPPTDSRGMPGFNRVLKGVLDAFQNRRDQVDEQSSKVSEHLNQMNSESVESVSELPHSTLSVAGQSLERIFDFEDGGFGRSPKFPHSMTLQVLMRIHARDVAIDAVANNWDQSRWMKMVTLNLDKMALGGIYDHLAGGFARYSVDEKWLVPHFEKMLYDNSLLMDAYLDGFTITQSELYQNVVRETFDYQLKYMTDDQGGFHATEDADSEGVEGKFYVWTPDEIVKILGDKLGTLFCNVYDVTPNGNFEGENILNLKKPLEKFAAEYSESAPEFRQKMRSARKKLLKVRDQRIRPGKDDKVLASWNGLMIHSMAKGSVVLNEPRYLNAAIAAADFVLNEMMVDDPATQSKQLLHTYRHGKAKIPGFLDDYSYFINALITLFETDGNCKWLQTANELIQVVVSQFYDTANGAFFFTSSQSEKLISRNKEFQDSSVPSGNSMMAMALLRYSDLTGDEKTKEMGQSTISRCLELIKRSPSAASQMLCALDRFQSSGKQIVIAANAADQFSILHTIYKTFSPNQSILIVSEELLRSGLIDDSFLQDKQRVDGKPTVYVCENRSCKSPLVGMEQIMSNGIH